LEHIVAIVREVFVVGADWFNKENFRAIA